MRILFPLMAFYPSQIGGVSITTYWLTKALYKEKIDVTIVSTNVGIEKTQIETNKFIRTDYGKVFYGQGNAFNPKIILKALSQVKHNDIVHINGLFDPIGLVTFIYTRLFFPSKILICSTRGVLSSVALSYSPVRKRFSLLFYRMQNKNVYFHGTSQKEIEEIKKVLKIKKNYFYLPNYIEPKKRFKNIELKKKFIFLGRIHPIKSIENLITAISVSNFFLINGFILEIVGTFENRHVSYYNKLKKLVQKLGLDNTVKFSGHIEGKDKERKLAESYALVLPSSTENFGNVVLEALNHGTPVIASKYTPWEILEKYKTGIYTDNTPQALANSIDSIIKMNKKEYLSYRTNSINLIVNKYTIKNNIYNWVERYNTYIK